MSSLAIALASASALFSLPPGLLSAVCYTESRHNISAYASNDGGTPSIGPCQIKYSTAIFLGYKGTYETFVTDYRVNTYYAAKYLHRNLVRYRHNVVCGVAAYNAGHCALVKSEPRNGRYVRNVLLAWKEGR
jgi:soluble lytic murein transglycosylase-like protein